MLQGKGDKTGGAWQGRFISALTTPTALTPEFITSPVPDSAQKVADNAGDESPNKSLNTPTRRFAVYRNNVFSSLVGSMADGFPVVQKLVGEAFFKALASAYVSDNLPTSPVMYFYGDNFAEFIDGFAPAKPTPYLGDVARLEYARRVALAAADVPIVEFAVEDAGKDADAVAENFLSKKAELHPSVHIITSAYPIHSLWLRNTSNPDQPVPAEGEHVLVWRETTDDGDYGIASQTLPLGGVEFFTAISKGKPVYAAAEAATQAGGEANLQSLMQQLLRVTTKLTPAEAT